MNSNKSNWIVGVAVAVAAIAWGIWKFRPVEAPPSPSSLDESDDSGSMRADRAPYVAPEDPALMNQVFDLEHGLAEIDATVWAGEMLSHRYGDVVVELWDELRHEGKPLKTLGAIPFTALTLAGVSIRTEHEWGIEVLTTGGERTTLNPDQWRAALQKWWDAGYRLEASEWRHTRFDPPTNGVPAKSGFPITWNVVNDQTRERITIQGTLDVAWKTPDDPLAAPVMDTIDASALTITRRTGDPLFEKIESKVVMPFTNSVFIEPLMVYDLNSDGLMDWMLGCRNQVYWNRGGGKFELGTLCRFRPERPFTMTLGDFDGDGNVDLLSGDVHGLELFRGGGQGAFDQPAEIAWDADAELGNPFVLATGDIDRDGDLDVWLAQYKVPYATGQMPTPYYDANDGFPGYLLLNDGTGRFTDATAGSGLAEKRFRRAYSCSFVDLDEDGDLDFVVVSDFAGVDYFLNDGKGRFTDVTGTRIDEPRALGMGHTIGDFNLDGQFDLYVIGMVSYAAQRMTHLDEGPKDRPDMQRMRPVASHGSRMYFGNQGAFTQSAMSDQVANTGWSWGTANADFDNDGDPDVVVNNGQLSRESARDYETQFWRHDIYLADSDPDDILGVYFNMTQTRLFGEGWSYGGLDFNRFYLNENGRSWLSVAHQAGLALREDLRAVVASDLDNDGRVDLLFEGFVPWPDMQSAYYVYRNNWPGAGNWIGFRLREEGGGFSPIGARVNVTLNDGRVLKRALITGDSYRSQSPPVAHFGIGGDTSVKAVEFIWANGTRKTITGPAINQYHDIRGRN